MVAPGRLKELAAAKLNRGMVITGEWRDHLELSESGSTANSKMLVSCSSKKWAHRICYGTCWSVVGASGDQKQNGTSKGVHVHTRKHRTPNTEQRTHA